MKNHDRIHSTTKEIHYINTIGENTVAPSKFSKLQLLNRYKSAAQYRVDWKDINRLEVLDHVNKLIKAHS